MGHIVVPEAEKLLDLEIPVLDRGFVRLVDYLGGDARIVQTARVSYGEGTRTVREDAALIDYLMRHQHTSPFEHVVFEFHCKMPIFVARQWVRHRAARLNEISARYSVMKDEFYAPPPEQVRLQARDNKQGRAPEEVPPELQQKVIDLLRRDQERAYASYRELLADDIARELARINLPVSLYTQWYWQMDLHNLFHFLALRLDPHAQWEIRAYANALAGIVKAVAPMAWTSFERHVLNGCRLSADEIHAVRALIRGKPNPLSGRRLEEFERKIGRGSGRRGGAGESPAAAEGREDGGGATPDRGGAPAEAAAPAPPTPASLAGLRTEISAEEINALPLHHYHGPIHLVRDEDAARAAVEALARHTVLGFDTESRPSFRRGESHPVAIVQLASADEVYIFQLRPLGGLGGLARLFSDPRILKVGVALDRDVAKMREIEPFEAAGFVDLAPLTTALGIRNNGLRGLAAIVLGYRITKGAQRTNWARDELAPSQLSYAAMDAWVGREIHRALGEKGLLKKPAETSDVRQNGTRGG